MHLVMAVDDAKDIYIQCALLLHTPGYLAFSRECVLEKLLPELALYVWISENSAYSSHLFTDIVIHAPPSKQTEILTKASPVFIIRLKSFLSRGLVIEQ